MITSLYEPDGDGFVATLWTQGAWHPNQQHGGPVQALLARCAEHVPSLTPMQLARLTVDMVRPAPIGERLDVDTRIVREGKKIQALELLLRAGDTELVRATALRIRVEDMEGRVPIQTTTVAAERVLPPPEAADGRSIPEDAPGVPGFVRGVELRRFQVPDAPEGVYGFWVRVKAPLVAGEETSPMARLMVAADMTNTIGVLVDPTTYTTINPDMSIHVLRPPAGEWVSVAGDTRFALGAGLGISDAILGDRDRVCAVASTSQLVQLR